MSIWKDPKVELPREQKNLIVLVKDKTKKFILYDVYTYESDEDYIDDEGFLYDKFRSETLSDMNRYYGNEETSIEWDNGILPIKNVVKWSYFDEYEEDLIKQAEEN